MNNILRALVSGLLTCVVTTTWSYSDAVTHPALSSQAAKQSALYDGALTARLGIQCIRILLSRQSRRQDVRESAEI
jgi:hypothetical protein